MKTSELRAQLLAQEDYALIEDGVIVEEEESADEDDGEDLLEALWLLKDVGEFLENVMKYAKLRTAHQMAAKEHKMAIYDFLAQFEEFCEEDDIDVGGEA